MKVTLEMAGAAHECEPPASDDATDVLVLADPDLPRFERASCPGCRAEAGRAGEHRGVPEFRVRGKARECREDDRGFRAPAVCVACGQVVGTLDCRVSTIFGRAEDALVLGGPWKVY